ncbi:HTH_Tnp_Tc3_2 domain-containing protein [Trichonephila clavipes]|nr:HTH_Tnp_Tc3_2 domain-containing protein [Trichonephila clavipes]
MGMKRQKVGASGSKDAGDPTTGQRGLSHVAEEGQTARRSYLHAASFESAFGVGKSSVSRIIKLQNNFGTVSPKRKSKCGCKRKTTPRTDKFLAQNCTIHLYKTNRDLQRELLATGVSVDSSTVRLRLIEAGRFARKSIEKQLLTPAMKKKMF